MSPAESLVKPQLGLWLPSQRLDERSHCLRTIQKTAPELAGSCGRPLYLVPPSTAACLPWCPDCVRLEGLLLPAAGLTAPASTLQVAASVLLAADPPDGRMALPSPELLEQVVEALRRMGARVPLPPDDTDGPAPSPGGAQT